MQPFCWYKALDNTPYVKTKFKYYFGETSERYWTCFHMVFIQSSKVKPRKVTFENYLKNENENRNIKLFNQRWKRVKLLGSHIDGKPDLRKKANKKLDALARICKYMDARNRRTLKKAFFTSQFLHCSLVWMFHSRNKEGRLNKIPKEFWN